MERGKDPVQVASLSSLVVLACAGGTMCPEYRKGGRLVSPSQSTGGQQVVRGQTRPHCLSGVWEVLHGSVEVCNIEQCSTVQ